MKVEYNNKLFIVEFGKPDMGSYISFGGGGQRPLYVIAKTYDEAAQKGLEYAIMKTQSLSVVSYDGSIVTPKNEEEIMVKSVRLACEEIVW